MSFLAGHKNRHQRTRLTVADYSLHGQVVLFLQTFYLLSNFSIVGIGVVNRGFDLSYDLGVARIE